MPPGLKARAESVDQHEKRQWEGAASLAPSVDGGATRSAESRKANGAVAGSAAATGWPATGHRPVANLSTQSLF